MWVSVLYAVFKPKNIEMGLLLDYYFSSWVNTYNYLVPLVHRGAKNTMNIGNEDFLNGAKISLPKQKEEQKKITDFLGEIDKRIEQLKEKRENLEKYKKWCDSKVFSKKRCALKMMKENLFPIGKHTPLKKFLKRYSNPVAVEPNKLYQQIGIRSHGKGIFYKESVTGKSLGNKRVFWIKENKLILNIVFAWERAISKTTINEIGMIASHRFPMYEPVEDLLNLDFILYFFLTLKGKSYLELASPGGAGRNKTLGQVEFEKLKISIPSLKEQNKISSFLQEIDEDIRIADKKIEQTKLFRKGLLQKMFCV